MGQSRGEITQNLAERWCCQAARRDDSRVARRLYRQQVVDGVYRLDAGAWLDDFCSFLQERGSATCWTTSKARRSNVRWSPACRLSCSRR
jgi:hypothetical protein